MAEAEYIEREKAKKATCEWCNAKFGEDACEPCDCSLIVAIDDIPAADVVEVVRCKDCRFFTPSTYSDDWCSAKSPGVSKGMCTPSGDSYCSDAERRKADEEENR